MWEMVPFVDNAVYHQLRACDYAPFLTRCYSFGFWLVAGDPFRRTQNDSDPAQRAVHMVCLTFDSFGAANIMEQGPGFPKQRCDKLRAEVYFPSMLRWKNLDSPSQNSYGTLQLVINGGVCPESHPVALFSIFYEFFFYLINLLLLLQMDIPRLMVTVETSCMFLISYSGKTYWVNLIWVATLSDIGLHNPIHALPGNNTWATYLLWVTILLLPKTNPKRYWCVQNPA